MKVPFPHGLDVFAHVENIQVRFVSNALDLEKQYHFSSHSRQVAYEIVEIVEERKAKGDWSKWDTVPNYYLCNLKAVPKVDFEKLVDVN